MTKTKIVITGGSGFIGTNLIELLASKKYDIINFDIQPPKKNDHKIFWKKIDINEKNLLMEAFNQINPDYVINLAADLGMDHLSLDTLKTNTLGVENLIDSVKMTKSVKRILFTSSLLVCKNGYIPKNFEDYCPPNYYGKSKMIGEKIVKNSNLQCEWAIIRPTSIWGPWFDYSYKKFFQMVDKNRYFHLGKSEFQKPASFVGNTAFSFQKILFSDAKIINKSVFYIADYPWYSTKKWANSIQKVLDSKKILTAPIALLKMLAFSGDLLKFFLRFDPPLTSFRLKNMLTGGKYPLENTKKVVGKLPYSLNESTFLTANWMSKQKLIKHKPKEI